MSTLSQVVDEVAIESARPDLLVNITSYVNLTIRELHIDPRSGNAIGFADNIVEMQLTANLETGFVYELPQPELFQFLEACWYRRGGKMAVQKSPSTVHQFESDSTSKAYYYRTGPALAFSGYGGNNQLIDLAISQYPRGLRYYKIAERPVRWDPDTDMFVYLPLYDTTPEQREKAQWLSTNWIIRRHKELVKQGTLAKLYTRLKDVDRARLAYSLYEQLRPGFVSAESYERGTYYMT